jgi:TPP-dependent pyruvate/acetoin dehydrogenase alpha subunit
VPEEVFEEWRKKDPIQRFEAHLAETGALDAEAAAAVAEEATTEVVDAVKASSEVAAPTLDSIFSDVLDEMPGHLAAQRDHAVAFQERAGAFEGPSGEFPL